MKRGLYHTLNRVNRSAEFFHKPEVYPAFDRILAEGLAAFSVKLFCFALMLNHRRRVLQPAADGKLSRFMR